MAESPATLLAKWLRDPLNLMRVMPTQGGQPCFSSTALFFKHEWTRIDTNVNWNHGLHG